jgi:hypothetical protein
LTWLKSSKASSRIEARNLFALRQFPQRFQQWSDIHLQDHDISK